MKPKFPFSFVLLLSLSSIASANDNAQPSIASFAHTTLTKSGHVGDPINIGLVGTRLEIVAAMEAAGWFPADPVTIRTSLKITGSVLLRHPYKAAPVSPLFYQGHIQDLAFEKPDGKSAAHRHHVRFWLVLKSSPDGRPIWLGSGTYDRSVGLSHVNGKITHHIAADVDMERDKIVSDLKAAKELTADYFVTGAGPIKDARNGGGDHYHSDGQIHFAEIASP